jgi:hypothetical protein
MSLPIATVESEKTKDKNMEYIDSIIQFHKNNAGVRETVINDLYDSYNGIVKKKTKVLLEKKFGKQISTQFLDYKLGHAKIKLLKGEYLGIEFSPTVTSINPDILDKRIKFANKLRGAAKMKKFLTALKKQHDVDPMEGLDIPEPDDPDMQNKMFPKTANEIVMQHIIDEKIESGYLKLKGQSTFMDIIIGSECHAVVERDAYGEDTIRMIAPEDAVFQELTDDPFALESPFKGERKWMYVKDVITRFPKLTDPERKRLKEGFAMASGNHGGDNKGFRSINGIPAVEVYILQWKNTKAEYTKVTEVDGKPNYYRDITKKYTEDKKYKKEVDRDVKAGKYKVEVDYHDDLWQGIRIDQDIYTEVERTESQIQRLTSSNKYRAEYDYVNFLFGTVNGIRMSLQGLISGLSEVNNIIMHMMVREIKKMKGKVFVYDEAVKPKHKLMKNIFFDITENGVITINSSAEGNFSNTDVQNAVKLIQELDLGLSQSFDILLKVKNDVENTMDRITGINESREGQSPTSQTATGTMQNIEASRSITRDIFYGHQMFMNRLFSNLVEKTKLNAKYLDSNRAKILLGDNGINFIKASSDFMFDDFDVKFTDGGREKEIRDKVARFFDVEINSGNLRTQDVIKFDMTKNLNDGIRVLQAAWGTITQVRREELQAQSEQQQQQIQGQQQLAQEDREDRQAHEKELKQMDLDSKERTKGTELEQKDKSDQVKSDTIINKESISNNDSN